MLINDIKFYKKTHKGIPMLNTFNLFTVNGYDKDNIIFLKKSDLKMGSYRHFEIRFIFNQRGTSN